MSVHLLRSISNFRAAVLLRSLSALALTLAAPAKSPAQGVAPDDEVVRLARFQISGEREHDYASVLSSGGTKTSTPLAETPQAISVVTRFQIEDQAAQTLQEVLRYAPGVRAETFGVDNAATIFCCAEGVKARPSSMDCAFLSRAPGDRCAMSLTPSNASRCCGGLPPSCSVRTVREDW